MYASLVDPWRVIAFYEAMCLIVFGLVVIGLTAELICVLVLCFRRESRNALPHWKHQLARFSAPKTGPVSTLPKSGDIRRHEGHGLSMAERS